MKPLREGAMVLGLALGGRILGFGRTVLTAAVAGAGPAADAFFVAFRIVGLLRAVMGGGLNAAFVPLFVRLAGNGRGRARAFSADALATTGAAAAAVAAIAAIGMPWVVQVSAPGLPDGTGPPAVPGLPDDLARSVTFARIMLPCLVFGALALVLRAVLNGLGRHGAGAAMPAAFNLAAIASLLTLEPLLPGPLHSLAAGIALGGAAQLALVAAACRRAGFAVPPALPRLRPETGDRPRGAGGAGIRRLRPVRGPHRGGPSAGDRSGLGARGSAGGKPMKAGVFIRMRDRARLLVRALSGVRGAAS